MAPEFAAAYAGLADAYVTASAVGILPLKEGLAHAKEAAAQALRLDPASSEAYSAYGFAGLLLDRDWETTEKNLLEAIELNPSNKLALQWYALYLTALARHEEAIATIKKAVSLDPLSPFLNSIEGLLHYFARDYEQAIKIFSKSLVTHPNYAFTYYWLAITYIEIHKYDEALESIQKALELDPQDPTFDFRQCLGRLYALKGLRTEAFRVLDEIEEQDGHATNIYIALGETDKAFEALERWFDRQYQVPLFKVAPWYDPIRSDPRFEKILKKAHLEN